MGNMFNEGNLQIKFTDSLTVEKFDDTENVPYGMKSVDFLAEDDDCLYFIEVKDYQHPKATQTRRIEDIKMLSALGTMENDYFCLEMGAKIKDSLLRRYALGKDFTKKVLYVLLINLDVLGEQDRRILSDRIRDYVPTGLNDEKFCAFSSIQFSLANLNEIAQYGITCTVSQ